MKTTLKSIRSFNPCVDSWKMLLAHFGKKRADKTEVRIVDILDLLGLEDALWALRAVEGHDREIRLFAVACARRVQYLMTDPRSLNALAVAGRFANGQATKGELVAADKAARDAARDAAGWAAYWAAYWAAGLAADWAAEMEACAADDREAERAWQAEELRRVCLAIEAGEDPYQKKEETINPTMP